MLSKKWTLITRAIIPVLAIPSFAPPPACTGPAGCPSTFGIGDIDLELAFAPKTNPGGIIWGIGPQITFPSASDPALSAGKYSAGPALVGLVMPGHWVTGARVTQLWSFSNGPYGATKPNVNQGLYEPFINYNMKGGWSLKTVPVITANYEAQTMFGNRNIWTVPVGGGFSKTFKLGDTLTQAGLTCYTNVANQCTRRKPLWSSLGRFCSR